MLGCRLSLTHITSYFIFTWMYIVTIYFVAELEKIEEKEKEKAHLAAQSTPDPGQSEGRGSPEKELNKEPEEDIIKEAPINSEMGPWSEDIQLNWSQVILRDDLLGLRNFFKQGMSIAVMEEMVRSMRY